jgi:hypothetical protein
MGISTAIQNVGEYYSPHYLDAAFDEDVTRLFQNDAGRATPAKALAGLGETYFSAKEEVLLRNRSRGGAQKQFVTVLKNALGYGEVEAVPYYFAGSKQVLLLTGCLYRLGESWLALYETPNFHLSGDAEKQGDPLESQVTSSALSAELVGTGYIPAEFKSLSKLVSAVFGEENSPRWCLVFAGGIAYLFDKHVFVEGRYLLFDFEECYGKKEDSTFRQISTLLSRATLASESDFLLDDLEDNSHKYAYGVTEKLQFAVREAIGILANEWVESRRTAKLSYTKVGEKEVKAEDLKHEALVYIYRMLFCLYAEAKGEESGLLPIGNEVYRLGYSLEALRDLELVPLNGETSEGTYFHEHLLKLFSMIQKGFPEIKKGEALINYSPPFRIPALTSTLFDPEDTRLLDSVKLRNSELQKVIVKLSLSESAKGRGRGRINYGDLGINQLGAVYEGILSYSGKFAHADLIQVAVPDKGKAPDFNSSSTQTWFVEKERAREFPKESIESTEAGLRIYPKGSFILFLSHVERERSASYYTPEVLTRCLVEEALEELTLARPRATADEILQWKICEPAMGSGAFLNEACEEIAALYLKKKQEELGERIEPETYQMELRRAKYLVATRNVYGVDLNPMAVELGSLSLWLGTQHRLPKFRGSDDPDATGKGEESTSAVPWFGLRLRAGNSLIGARRAVWKAKDLQEGTVFQEGKAPRVLRPGEARLADEVYHFLVFDPEMLPVRKDKLFKEFYPAQTKDCETWAKQNTFGKWEKEELDLALQVSERIDTHWFTYTEERNQALATSESPASVWPVLATSDEAHRPGVGLARQEEIRANLEKSSGSFQRIKLLMDVWCSLYFWNAIDSDATKRPPTQRSFLFCADLLLGESLPTEESKQNANAFEVGIDLGKLAALGSENTPSVAALARLIPWVGETIQLTDKNRFHHWELVFPEVLGPSPTNSGFALMLGNPPWLKQEWASAPVLNEMEPLLAIKGAKSADYGKALPALVKKNTSSYFTELLSAEAISICLNDQRLYPELRKIQSNLYKNFIVRTWTLLAEDGVCGLLHPTGVFDDPNGGWLREEYIPRLKRHLHFVNELLLFAEVGDQATYSLNIFKGLKEEIAIQAIFNLYHPKTLVESRKEILKDTIVPGIKTTDGNWELRGHPHRLLRITETELAIFAELFEAENPLTTKLPQVHTSELLEVLAVVSRAESTLSDLKEKSFSTEMYHESNAQRDGIIVREDNPSIQPKSPKELVLVGPLIFVGNPHFNSAYTQCTEKAHFNRIDLTTIKENFLPRSPYRLLKDEPFLVTMGEERVDARKYYRVAWRIWVKRERL